MKNKKKLSLWILGVILFFIISFQNSLAGSCSYSDGACINGITAPGNDCVAGGGTYSNGDCPPGNNTSNIQGGATFPNPIGFNSVSGFLDAVLNNLMGIIAIIAVIFIVIGGLMYMTSAGDEKMITRAKKTWTAAVIGLAIALAAPTFLKEIQNILGGANGTGGSAQSWVSNALTIRQIAVNVLNLLLSVIGIAAMIAMVVGGGAYLTAYGDERKIDTGKKIITYAIIGIVVALAALVIVRQVDAILRGGA